MKVKELKLQDFANPKRWKLLNYSVSSAKQSVLRIGHINPEIFMDKEKGIARQVNKEDKEGKIVETTITVGVRTLRGSMTDYYEGMMKAIQAGLITGITVKDIQDMREKTNDLNPEECDSHLDVSVADYEKEKIASQTLENMVTQTTKGLMNVPLPGMSNNMTFAETLQNPLVKKEILKQVGSEKELDKLLKEFNRASEEMVKGAKESNFKYNIEKFNKYPAVYFSSPSTSKPIKKAKRKSGVIEIKNSDGTVTKIKPSGGSDMRVKYPPNAFEKEDLPIDGKILQAIQVGQFIISGSLVTSLHYMPKGEQFCHSLTKFRTETKITHSEGMTFIEHTIFPVNSTLEKEGYLNREEVKEMILNIISLL